jgi:hypothetical protein
MDNNAHNRWDIVFKWIGLLTAVVAGIFTYYKFRVDRAVDLEHLQQSVNRDEKARKDELNSFIFQRQSGLYFDAARSAATIATSKDVKRLKDAHDRFEELYWGELVVVEDRRVELSMISFYHCYKESNCERVDTNQFDKHLDAAVLKKQYGEPTLENLSLELAACIRSALQDDRGIQFGNRRDARTSCPYD